jgi:hypothetical protein
MARHSRVREETRVVPLARHQVLVLIGLLALVAGTLMYGLGYALVTNLGPRTASPHSTPAEKTADDAVRRRDAIAAAPMATVAQDAATTPGVALALPSRLVLPAAGSAGHDGVPTGFPHSPEGAAAQLAAIEIRVLSAMSLPLTMGVYNDWALPGGVGASDWSQTHNVQSFLTHARQSSNTLDPGTLVNVAPAAIQIKGSDGPDWVLACVLLDVRAALVKQARMGYGTCERMQWTGERWLIGPGAPPSLAPSAWPGSDASVAAGWLPVTPR